MSWHYIKEYIKFQFNAKHHKGHGVHSPFVFSLIEDIFNEKHPYYAFKNIERTRKNLLSDHSSIYVNDFGTGISRERKVSEIANTSLKSKRRVCSHQWWVCNPLSRIFNKKIMTVTIFSNSHFYMLITNAKSNRPIYSGGLFI